MNCSFAIVPFRTALFGIASMERRATGDSNHVNPGHRYVRPRHMSAASLRYIRRSVRFVKREPIRSAVPNAPPSTPDQCPFRAASASVSRIGRCEGRVVRGHPVAQLDGQAAVVGVILVALGQPGDELAGLAVVIEKYGRVVRSATLMAILSRLGPVRRHRSRAAPLTLGGAHPRQQTDQRHDRPQLLPSHPFPPRAAGKTLHRDNTAAGILPLLSPPFVTVTVGEVAIAPRSPADPPPPPRRQPRRPSSCDGSGIGMEPISSFVYGCWGSIDDLVGIALPPPPRPDAGR